MLTIYIDNGVGEPPSDVIFKIDSRFNFIYEPEWFEDDFIKRIIYEIDRSEVAAGGKGVNLYNDVMGNFPPDKLSGGCKTLILLYKDDNLMFNGDRLGDNCFDLLLEIADIKDISISLSHIPSFPRDFKAVIQNNGDIIYSKNDFIDIMLRRFTLPTRNGGVVFDNLDY